jgi:hypothetical protein
MRFDREAMRDIVSLEYRIEKKTEDELLASGFRIKKRIRVPKHITDVIGPINT